MWSQVSGNRGGGVVVVVVVVQMRSRSQLSRPHILVREVSARLFMYGVKSATLKLSPGAGMTETT